MAFGRFLRVLAVLSVVGSVALAAPQGSSKGKPKEKADSGIELTGIESFDSVFARVGEIDARLASAEAELRTGKRNLNGALELKKGTPLADGLAELQARAGNKLELTVTNRAVPKLSATDAVPTNVQQAVDAVNRLTENMTTSLTDLRSLQPEIEGLVSEVGDMPARLTQEFSGGSASLFEQLFALPKTSKALKHDIDVTLGLADRTTALTSRMTDLLGVVNTEFGGPQQQPRKAPASGKPAQPGKKKPTAN